jgi:hypothetical protein
LARRKLRISAGVLGRASMLDVVMLALGLALFAAAIGYTYACERL